MPRMAARINADRYALDLTTFFGSSAAAFGPPAGRPVGGGVAGGVVESAIGSPLVVRTADREVNISLPSRAPGGHARRDGQSGTGPSLISRLPRTTTPSTA